MERLTPRQVECLRMRCRGLNGRQIGTRLFISPSTVKNHLTEVYRILGIGLLNDARMEAGAKDAFACYLLGMADAATILDPGSTALRSDYV